jgi:hypothetical protein
MPDRLYLSLWIQGFDAGNMLLHFRQLLDTFPFSRLRPGISLLRVYAIEEKEPPLLEQAYAEAAAGENVLAAAAEFEHPDCAYIVDGWWELWQFEGEWKLAPARVTLFCFGPQFENDEGDHLRIDLGEEEHFLPDPDVPLSVKMVQSNLQGVLRLVRELEAALPVERRALWSESGENFAERLEENL